MPSWASPWHKPLPSRRPPPRWSCDLRSLRHPDEGQHAPCGGAGPRLALAHERSACHITVRFFALASPADRLHRALPRTERDHLTSRHVTRRALRHYEVIFDADRYGQVVQCPGKGFGFIQPDNGGPDAFVHISAVERAGLDNLREGERIQYELEQRQERQEVPPRA